ncbi:ComF family protein [Roseateles sp.]|jgi:ComF family protein|uniref:ComF family protein n=1 Tax=Roseateles sp. TaxID=1971397 RepID=UPI0037C7AEF0
MDYASPWDLLIQGIKLHQTLDLVGLLLERLDCALDVEEVSAPDWLLPVRLSTQRLQGRGVNQCWEPARRLAARRQLRCSAAMLLRVRDMSHQLALPAEQRAANVRQAFLIEPRQTHHLRGRHVAVLDDVMTTGATIHELALTLRRAGALSVQAWALAHTPDPRH